MQKDDLGFCLPHSLGCNVYKWDDYVPRLVQLELPLVWWKCDWSYKRGEYARRPTEDEALDLILAQCKAQTNRNYRTVLSGFEKKVLRLDEECHRLYGYTVIGAIARSEWIAERLT